MAKCLSESDPEKCQGFTDEWSQSREEHYTETVHDEECPKHPERQAEARAEAEQERWEEEELERQSENEPIPWDDLD